MTIIALSKDDYYEHLDKPHNPPDEAIPTATFDEEYYRLFDRVSSIMCEHGDNNAYGEGDYNLESGIARSRGLGLEITNASIVTEHLLRRLQTVVCQHAPDWEIYLGSAQYDFGIFIGPTIVRLYRRSNNVLPQLNEFVADVA